MTISHIEINKRKIGPDFPVYIIAELSANHSQDFAVAEKLVRLAKEAGADAVKLQTFTPDTITINCSTEQFQIKGGTLWDGMTLYDLYSTAYMPWEWQPKLGKLAQKLGIDLFSTPFDRTAVDFLEEMHVPAYKIASFEIVDIPLIKYIASKGKPIIISNGMATLDEIDEALQTIKQAGTSEIALLKCISSYPTPPETSNLRAINYLAKTFSLPVGLSDHTVQLAVPVAAVALGACIIEKHFTISRSIPTLDGEFSLEPEEFAEMVKEVRAAEKALGNERYELSKEESISLPFRRSLYVVEDIKVGELFTEGNVRSIRPAYGLHPRHLKEVLGQQATRDIRRGTPLSWELISGE